MSTLRLYRGPASARVQISGLSLRRLAPSCTVGSHYNRSKYVTACLSTDAASAPYLQGSISVTVSTVSSEGLIHPYFMVGSGCENGIFRGRYEMPSLTFEDGRVGLLVELSDIAIFSASNEITTRPTAPGHRQPPAKLARCRFLTTNLLELQLQLPPAVAAGRGRTNPVRELRFDRHQRQQRAGADVFFNRLACPQCSSGLLDGAFDDLDLPDLDMMEISKFMEEISEINDLPPVQQRQ
uniref:Uncharacterized protein n=1 Tax=Macrostomum lignano TaxID=282301 RepID=A0A1I8FES3_9PLAT